jgi:mannan endo-1,4-beta-mannosidase
MRGTFTKFLYRGTLVLILLAMVSCTPSQLPTLSSAEGTLSTNTAAPSATNLPTLLPASTETSAPTAIPQQPFVKIKDLGFSINDRPFQFIGANALNFGFYDQYGLSMVEGIQSARQAGLKVLRISLAWNNEPWGKSTFEAYDQVLDLAAKNGLYVIANLTEGCCYSGTEKREDYFARSHYANFTDQTEQKNFKDFIQSMLLRKNSINGRIYRDDPTIMAWDIINEPGVELFTPAELNTWLVNTTAYIKSIDPNHLVTLGLNTSSDIYSTPGDHYSALNVPDLDFYSFHYNLNYFQDVPSHLDPIRYRVEMLRSMGKPVVMEEFGIGSQRIFPDNVSQEELVGWVKDYKDQLDITFKSGASGALFWGWGVPGTKQVLLWWSDEDHDSTETLFVQMLKDYGIPLASTQSTDKASIATPIPPKVVPADVFVHAVCTLINQPKQKVVSPDSPVVILWGWKTDTAQHLQDYIDNTVTTVTLDGKDLAPHAPFWVANNDPGNFKMYWFARVGNLSPGSHLLVTDAHWKKMIYDGTDTYGPGGKTESTHDECEILIQ